MRTAAVVLLAASLGLALSSSGVAAAEIELKKFVCPTDETWAGLMEDVIPPISVKASLPTVCQGQRALAVHGTVRCPPMLGTQ